MHYAPGVCGFARGEAGCNIWVHNALVWYPNHTCCNLETTFRLATLILREVITWASTRTCILAYRKVNY